MTVTLDNKKIYEETDDNVELSVWDIRLSSKMIVFFSFSQQQITSTVILLFSNEKSKL